MTLGIKHQLYVELKKKLAQLPPSALPSREVFCDLRRQNSSNDFTDFSNEIISINVVDYLLNAIDLQNQESLIINFRLNHHPLPAVVNKLQILLRHRLSAAQQTIKEQEKKSIFLSIIGFLILIIGFSFGRAQQVSLINETVLIVGWVFIWHATEIFFLERRDALRKEFKLLQLYFADFKSN